MADPFNTEFTERSIEPLFKASTQARLVIVGQAPGRKAEATRLFWNDPSGDRLRLWMDLTRDEFYGSEHIAQIPMDFYYPGKASHGDRPPRRGFAETWHPRLLAEMPNVECILLIGNYAQAYYLGKRRERNLTETVRHFQQYLPAYLPLVHPSPLNIGWFKRNTWFEDGVIPVLREIVSHALR